MNESITQHTGKPRVRRSGTDGGNTMTGTAAEPFSVPVPSLSAGLTEAEAERSRALRGANTVRPAKRPGFLRRFFSALNDPIIRILLAALAVNSVFSFSGSAGWAESVGIALTVLISALVSTLSERSSGASFEKLYAALGDSRCRVLRDGREKTVGASDIVTHDLVLLKPGDTVPADGILLSGNLRCDESPLTGESRSVNKRPEPGPAPSALRTGESSSLFRGSHVTDGDGILLVTAVGDGTMYGRIAGELGAEEGTSPLKSRLSSLARTIARIGYVSAGIVMAVHLADAFWFDAGQNAAVALLRLSDPRFVARELIQALTLAISVLVVAVPEGLPMMITVVLSANMKKMMKNNVLVRRLVGIETAGCIDMLFTDKTGTLTTGRLAAEGVLTVKSDGSVPASAVGERSQPPPRSLRKPGKGNKEAAEKLIRSPAGAVFLFSPSVGTCPGPAAVHLKKSAALNASSGNQTEKALSVFAGIRAGQPGALTAAFSRSSVPDTDRIPFDSARKYAAARDGSRILLRGAPDLLLPLCASWTDDGGRIRPMTRLLRDELESVIRSYGSQSARLILHAEADASSLPALRKGVLSDGMSLTFVCLSVLRDEVRKEVRSAVEECRTAGIRVIMLTGDNADTAEAVAKTCGILPENPYRVRDPLKLPPGDGRVLLDGAVLREMPDGVLEALLPRIAVISRVTPTDKSRLVRLAQASGHIVGMTGDGINDAPALKASDVGFAMGSGADVAREAGDIVITDDNFVSVTRAVLYGRTIFASIRKFITYQLTMNLAAVGVSVLGTAAGIENPVTVIQMLWINMIMDTLGSLAFAGEPALPGIMLRPPVRRDEPLLTRGMVGQMFLTGSGAILISMFFLLSPSVGGMYGGTRRLTLFFALFVFMGITIAFCARTPRINLFAHLAENRAFSVIMPAVAVIQLLIVYFGGEVFRCVPLPPEDLLRCGLIALTIVPLDTIRKCLGSERLRRAFKETKAVPL